MEPMKSEATDPNRKESPVPVKPRHDKKAVAWRHGNSVSATAQSPFGFIQKSFAKTGPSDLGIEEIKIGKANILSLAFYSWMTPLIWRLYRRGIGSVLKLTLMVEDTAEYNVKRLEEAWNDELLTRGPSGARLDRAIRTAYRSCLICSIISVVITLSFSFIGSSFIMRLLLTHIDKSDTPLWKNLGFVLMLVVCELFRSLTFSLGWCFNYWTGMRVRQAVIGLLYKRILQLRSLKDNKIGELMNMCSNDSQRLFEASANGSFVLGGPLVIIAGSVYLFFLIGPWAAVGMCTFILYFVFMKIVSGTLERFRREAVTLTGERVGLMTEVLTCMKLIKVNAWESAFKARLSEKRNEELSALEKASFTQSIIVSMVPMIPAIASVIMFIGHILTGNDLSVVEAFTITAVLYAMAFAMALMIHGIRAIADANVACARFKEVLLLEEMVPYSDNLESDTAVKISKATFAWDMEEEKLESTEKDSIIAGITVDELESFTPSIIDVLRTTSRITAEDSEHKCKDENKELKTNLLENSQEYQKIPQLCDISITAKKGELIGICGMKGSGKSSLLYAIMGRMQLQSGAVRVSGTVAYMGQEPFVMNGTARENITFGLPFDVEKFDRVVSACCLDKDFETFGAGDRVMIGDQGLTLSGGQKQRICLARAVYSESDIYLLDDPLSALDIHIGRHIFTHCLKILLKDKTVFFVTHHLEYMPQCDQVVLLHAGKVMEKGPHLELFETDKGPMYSEVYKLYQCNYNKIQRHRKQTCLSQEGNVKKQSAVKTPQRGFSRWSMHHLSRQLSVVSVHNDCHHQFSALSSSSVLSDHDYADIEKLMCSDEIFVTRVKWSIYKAYIRAMGGYGFLIFLLISFAVSIAIQSAVPGYLAYWLSQGDGSDPRTRQLSNSTTVGHGSVVDNPRVETYALTYGMFLVAMLLLMVLRSYTFVKILLNASRRLHHHLLKCTMTSPMKFFDTTPLAVILNRFSADLDEIDVRLPFNCEMNLQNVFMVLFALVVICYTFPWDLLVVLPLGVIFVVLAVTFAPILQQLKFVDSITRSPYMSHLTASMEGMATIYIYGQTDRFYKQFCGLLDQNSIAFFLFYMANRWLAVFLDLMVIIIIAATGFLIIFTVVDNHSTNSGLALSFAIQITSLLQYTLRLTVEAGSRFTSVQRLQEYVENLQAEGAIAGSCSEVPDDWPSEGAITFSRYTMRYNENLPPVLKGISLAIRPKEKIGIVGNSGSGKSSLGVALFRLCEASSGSIYIDNQNIRDVKLEALRSRISILVQDPVLFEGTVRYNLDPSKSHVKDANLWQALKRCHMKEKIESLECKLDTMVEENGKNFSRGERQLLCLARILLKNSKILVLDEATASVDMHTDFLVQQTIRMYCRDKTVLIIAHRINTIWDCDKVLVMENGKAVEFNSPQILLQKAHSKFREMYDAMKTMPRGASVKDDEPAESTFDERSESV